MRTLNNVEIAAVSGGTGTCTPENSGNRIGGINNAEDSGDFFIGLYEGAIQATSYVIERVANSL